VTGSAGLAHRWAGIGTALAAVRRIDRPVDATACPELFEGAPSLSTVDEVAGLVNGGSG
jgi:hypothetical protein